VINQLDYVELGLFCADVCTALDEGLGGRGWVGLGGSIRGAIEQLTT